ncbi:MAG: ATP-binding protein [Hyphomicrobiales bacterium]
MPFSFGHLRYRLIVLVLIAVLPLAGLMFFAASKQKQRSVVLIENSVLTMAEFAAREEEQMLDGSRQMLISTASALKGHWLSPSECSAFLAELLSHYRRYTNLGVVTNDGKLYCSAVPITGDFDALDLLWFRHAVARREFSIGSYQSGDHTRKPMVVLSYPVVGSDGQLMGVAFAALDIQWLNRFKLSIERDLPSGSIMDQVDEQGVILAHYPDPDAWVGRSLTQSELVKAFRSLPKGMLTLPGPDGQPWFYAFSELHSTLRNQKVHLLLGVPQRVVFEEANRQLVNNLSLLGAGTFLAFITAWFGIDIFVLRQVQAMLAATRKLTGGDLSARTGIAGQTGELNELAAAFDNMAAALENRDALRRRTDQELRSSREQLRNLSAHLQSIREEERTRLSREIHDELGQAMTALKMDIAWLSRRLDQEKGPLYEKTRSMDELVDETIRTVQRLSGELRPGLLDDLGLAAAMEWQAEEFQKRSGIPCVLNVALQDAALNAQYATAIFRIFQETLTNVIRHAQATRVSVRLQVEDGRLILVVKDNGRGITEAQTEDPKAFGLIGIRERAHALKGQFVISGHPGQGTTVTVTIPLAQEG